MRIKNYSILLLYLFSFFFAYAQMGTPNIININKNEYEALGQNWAIGIGNNGYIYAGNSKGLLECKGIYWKLYSLPKGEPVYALSISDDGKIYIGSYEEFGYFEPDKYGLLQYHSLSHNVKLSNEKINAIFLANNSISFHASNSYFIYENENVTAYTSLPNYTFLREINNQKYVYYQEKGIGIMEEENFNLLIPSTAINNDDALTILPLGTDLLIPTRNSGLYIYNGETCIPWNTDINPILRKHVISTFIQANDSLYVLGTHNSGLYAFNHHGNLIWKVSTADDLQNNTIHDLSIDNNNNIWAALDNGISYIENNSDIHFIRPYNNNIGAVFAALFYENYLYLATNQGLFYSKTDNNEFHFHLIPGLSGEANSLKIFDNQIICCHSRGTYRIDKEKAILLSDIKDATIIHKTTLHQQEVLIQAAAKSLNIYKKDPNGKWIFSHSIEDFLYPLKAMETDAQGNIWIAHYYKGLFRIKLNQRLRETEAEEHYLLPDSKNSENQVNLFKIKGRIVFGNNYSYYTYDDMSNLIIPFTILSENLKEIPDIYRVTGFDDNSYWCVSKKGFFKIFYTENEAYVERYVPFAFFNNDLPDYNINVMRSDEKVLFCLNNKIAITDNTVQVSKEKKIPNIQITSVEAFSARDTTFFEIYPEKAPVIGSKYNNIFFKIGAGELIKRTLQFKYKLEGLENNFSPLQPHPFREYNRLQWGKYTFHAIACDHLGNDLTHTAYEFEIEPPFYAGYPAIIVYILLTLLLGILISFLVRYIIRRSNRKVAKEQEALRQKENEQKEKEIIELKNEKLQSELYFKSKEMANSTFMLINKNNILQEVKNEINLQKEELGIRYPDKYYTRLIKIINSGINLEDNWSIFQANFDRIHENFFRNLKRMYPELTANDLKICALLRMNFSTKDIATYLGISIRGVDSARYRLRKKLNIDSERDIVEYLIQFKGHE